MNVKKGEIYLCDFTDGVGSEQSGFRPCIIISNDIGNAYSSCVIVALISSKINKSSLPMHVELEANAYGLDLKSIILCEQLRTIDKQRLKKFIGVADSKKQDEINRALRVTLQI